MNFNSLATTHFVLHPPFKPPLITQSEWWKERQKDAADPGFHQGGPSDDEITWNGDNDFNHRDVVYGGGGKDVIKTGGGDDKIVLGSNKGEWTGEGSFIGDAAIVEPGTGNDTVVVDYGATGSFYIQEEQNAGGSDRFIIRGGDYVEILDNGDERDFFVFDSSFRGDAVISTFDQVEIAGSRSDKLELFGNWYLDDVRSTGSSTVFARDVNHDGEPDATVTVLGPAGDGSDREYALRIQDGGNGDIPGFESGNTYDVIFV